MATDVSLSQKDKTLREALSFIKTLALFIGLALLIRGTLIEPFKIPSGSMIPTLQIGDRILVSKLSYGIRLPFMTGFVYQYGAPKRGDVVVFTRADDPDTSAEDESSINLIKRVVGLEGETVEVKNATLYINGKALEEPYARWTHGGSSDGEFGPQVVPAGKIFLMGDNRDQSRDSRFWNDHFLPTWRVKGRALLVYWNFESLDRIFSAIR